MGSQSLKKAFTYTAIIAGLFGIILQFVLMVHSRQTSLTETIIRFFSYFTILSNCLVVLFFISQLFSGSKYFSEFINKDEVATAITIYIIVVGVIYQTMLKNLLQLRGWNILSDGILHAFIPLLMFGYWLIFIS